MHWHTLESIHLFRQFLLQLWNLSPEIRAQKLGPSWRQLGGGGGSFLHAVDKVSCPVNVQQTRQSRKKQQGYAFIVKREKLSRPDPWKVLTRVHPAQRLWNRMWCGNYFETGHVETIARYTFTIPIKTEHFILPIKLSTLIVFLISQRLFCCGPNSFGVELKPRQRQIQRQIESASNIQGGLFNCPPPLKSLSTKKI